MARVAKPAKPKMPYCSWIVDEITEHFDTDCGKAWQFIDGGIRDNDVTYCPFCGRMLFALKDIQRSKDNGA